MEDCQALREETKELIASWEYRGIDPLDDESGKARMDSYIQTILPKEIECAKCDKGEPKRWPTDDLHCRTLVLMVGFSIDPLLMSLCAYNPSQVVLILNERYGDGARGKTGGEFGDYISQFISQLHPAFVTTEIGRVNDKLEFVKLDRDQPADVFRKLREVLLPRLKRGERLILDITGGKKSMIAGAFLFGAFAGVDISYVDFDEYDAESRTPRSYTSRVGLLPNPYETFRLREWERVHELYDRYAFRSLRELLGTTDDTNVPRAQRRKGLIDEMSGWFDERDIEAAKALRNITTMYERWESGDYSNAYQAIPKEPSTLTPPTAVSLLGANQYWPHSVGIDALRSEVEDIQLGPKAATNVRDLNSSLYLKPDGLLIYADDEVARIDRLIEYHEDYRSALLRAAGLSEFLLKARLVWWWCKDSLLLNEDRNGNWLTRTQINSLSASRSRLRDTQIAEATGVPQMLELLKGNTAKINALEQRGKGIDRVRLELQKDSFTEPMANFGSGSGISTDNLRRLRNDASHFCIPVSQDLARRSYKLVKHNLDDYAAKWACKLANVRRSELDGKLDWKSLCKACNIEFLL